MGVLIILFKGKLTNFLGVGLFDLDLLTIIVAYLYLSHGQTSASAFAFGQGLMIDVFSGGFPGVFTILYLAVFCAIFVGCLFFNLQTLKGQVIITAIAVLIKSSLFLVFIALFFKETEIWGSSTYMIGISAILTGMFSPFLFYIFTRMGGGSLNGDEDLSIFKTT